MPTSLADALASTGMIPAANASELAQPAEKKSDSAAMGVYAKDQEAIETARKDRDKVENNTPKFPTLAPEPTQDTSNDPIKGYTSVIGVLGAIGSMFTRRPMTNTMNAAAASINAMKQGEVADFNKKFDAWKVQNDNSFKLLDYQNKIYDTTLKSKNSSVDERIAEMQAHAAMFKDDYMMQLAKDRNIIEMEDLQLRRQEAGQKAQEYSQKIEEGKEKQDIFAQWRKENPNAKADELAAARARIFDPSVAAAQVRASETATKAQQNVDQAVNQVDELIDMIESSGNKKEPSITGISGMGRRVLETVETMVPSGADMATPASDFQSKISALKLQLPKLLTGTSKSATDERNKIDTILRGTSAGDTQVKTINALKQVRTILQEKAKHTEESEQQYSIGAEVMSPDGKKMRITGFDPEDGTPLGEPVE